MRIYFILAYLTFPGFLSHAINSLLATRAEELQAESIPCSLTRLQKSRNSKNTHKAFFERLSKESTQTVWKED